MSRSFDQPFSLCKIYNFLGYLILFIRIKINFKVIITFLYAHLETGRIMWLGMAGGRPHRFPHNNFCSVYRIFTKLGHMIPLWKGKNPIYFRVKGQGHRYYKYNFWQQGRFRKITLVLYIGSLTNLATWCPCGRGRTVFILGSLGQRSRSPLL
jgi:hypothetical protein